MKPTVENFQYMVDLEYQRGVLKQAEQDRLADIAMGKTRRSPIDFGYLYECLIDWGVETIGIFMHRAFVWLQRKILRSKSKSGVTIDL
jgi:hypothetical protein